MYKLNDKKMFCDIADGDAVIINFQTGVYYCTSKIGSLVIQRLLKGCRPGLVKKAVLGLEQACPETGVAFDDFVDGLVKEEILVPGPSVDGGDEPISPESLCDGLAFPLDNFNEIQDLILADPIHEVDVEEGWPVLEGEEPA